MTEKNIVICIPLLFAQDDVNYKTPDDKSFGVFLFGQSFEDPLPEEKCFLTLLFWKGIRNYLQRGCFQTHFRSAKFTDVLRDEKKENLYILFGKFFL